MFRIATEAERPGVLLFRKDAFEQEHAYAPLDRFDAEAVHLVAIEPARAMVSTARLLLPEQRPFDLEETIDFRHFLSPTAVPAMVGGFSVHPDFRSINKSILIQLGMLKLTFVIAQRYDVTDIVIYTFLHLLNFYKMAWFKAVCSSFFHKGYQRDMIVMNLNLHDFLTLGLQRRGRMSEILSQVHLEL